MSGFIGESFDHIHRSTSLPLKEELMKLLEEENQALRSRILVVESKVNRMENELQKYKETVSKTTKRNA